MPDAECPDQSARNLKGAAVVSECHREAGWFYFGPWALMGVLAEWELENVPACIIESKHKLRNWELSIFSLFSLSLFLFFWINCAEQSDK